MVPITQTLGELASDGLISYLDQSIKGNFIYIDIELWNEIISHLKPVDLPSTQAMLNRFGILTGRDRLAQKLQANGWGFKVKNASVSLWRLPYDDGYGSSFGQ